LKKIYYILSFVLLLTLFGKLKTQSQILIDDKELITIFQGKKQKIDYAKPLKESKNEIDILLSASFLFYKTFISSQDKPSCVFSPSCSVYSVEAFKEKGAFFGWLYTFDRLSRCHPLVKPSHYHYDIKNKRYHDPID